MNAQEAEKILRDVLNTNIGPDVASLELSSTWEEVGDELDLIEFLIEVEKRLSIDIPDEHSARWVTLQDTVNYLEKLP